MGPRPRRRVRRHVPTLILLIPLVTGLLSAPSSSPTVSADELSDAKAKQAALKERVAKQKAEITAINDLQQGLAAEIADTKNQLAKVGADLDAVRKKISRMQTKINQVKADYADLVAQLADMDQQLAQVTAQEDEKRLELAQKRAQLADRVRSAYDTDRTSPLETFLSGGSFTDLLAEMSYYIDVGEQDKALAEQIERDQEALAAVHQTVQDTRLATEKLRVETAAQKKKLDKAMAALKKEQKKLRKLEKAAQRELARQKAAYAKMVKNKKGLKKAIARAQASQRALAKRIDKIIAAQQARGNIPSKFNGSFRWPLVGRVSGEFGCSSYPGYGPGYGCAHFHNGIDIVGPYGAPIRAAGKGTVVYVGWNYADGSDPAWIVVIAHSSNLQTWYAHMKPTAPVSVGQHVSAGQVIGYEGLTGNTTGAHLHWMVELNGVWKNPRLFL